MLTIVPFTPRPRAELPLSTDMKMLLVGLLNDIDQLAHENCVSAVKALAFIAREQRLRLCPFDESPEDPPADA